jgi:pilus assembly protein Flp/PilA
MKGAPALGWESTEEEDTMNTMLLKMYIKLQNLMSREEGQDLVEYALLIALIAFGATAGMSKLATGISTAFSNISVQLSTNIT